jgi:hypothetical protein
MAGGRQKQRAAWRQTGRARRENGITLKAYSAALRRLSQNFACVARGGVT